MEKAKKGKKGKNKLPKVDAQFYELELADLKKKLVTARSYIKTLEEENLKLHTSYTKQKNFTSTAAAVLQTQLNASNIELSETKRSIDQLTDLHKKQILEYSEHIKDIEKKYKVMHTQLVAEIKMITGQLNILDEYRQQRTVVFEKLEMIERSTDGKMQQLREQLRDNEATMLLAKQRIKTEVIDNLSKLYENLTKYNQLQQVSYVRHLLRNNVALSRELHEQMRTNFDTKKSCYNIEVQTQKISEENEYLKSLKVELITNCRNKFHIIQSLVRSYERLKVEYMEASKYRRLYEKLKNRKDDMNKDQMELQDNYIKLRRMAARLQTENNAVNVTNNRLQNQINSLTASLNNVRRAIAEYITIQKFDDDSSSSNSSYRQNLVSVLENILCGYHANDDSYSIVTETRSILDMYEPGMVGLLQMKRKQPSFMNLLKSKNNEITSKITKYSSGKLEKMHKAKQNEQIIPEERHIRNNMILDVEIGSTLYVSSSTTSKDEEAEVSEKEGTDAEEESDEDVIDSSEVAKTLQQKLTDAETDKTVTSKNASSDEFIIEETAAKNLRTASSMEEYPQNQLSQHNTE